MTSEGKKAVPTHEQIGGDVRQEIDPRVRMLFRLTIILFCISGMLALALAWLYIPHAVYIQNIRTQQLEVIGPDADLPAVTLSAGPGGQGSLVVNSGSAAHPAIVLTSDQHSVGVITLLAPNDTGVNEPHVQLSGVGGVLQSTGKSMAWRLSCLADGGGLLLADSDGRVFAELRVSERGNPELVITSRDGKSVTVGP